MTSSNAINMKTYEINVLIVENVKTHPVLYDQSLPEYEKKMYSKAAWESVSNAVGIPVDYCKARWRNLWLSFLRYQRMKKDPNAQVKPYYLQEDMTFLLPYIKSRPEKGGSRKRHHFVAQNDVKRTQQLFPQKSQKLMKFSVENEEGQDIEIEYLEDGCEQQEEVIITENLKQEPLSTDGDEEYVEQEYTEEHDSYTEPQNEYMEQYDEQQEYVEEQTTVQETPQKYYEIVSTTEEPQQQESGNDPDMDFMKSFLPDIRKMSPGQKIRFKMSLCSAIHEILYS